MSWIGKYDNQKTRPAAMKAPAKDHTTRFFTVACDRVSDSEDCYIFIK